MPPKIGRIGDWNGNGYVPGTAACDGVDLTTLIEIMRAAAVDVVLRLCVIWDQVGQEGAVVRRPMKKKRRERIGLLVEREGSMFAFLLIPCRFKLTRIIRTSVDLPSRIPTAEHQEKLHWTVGR